jgi:hypothetical protein
MTDIILDYLPGDNIILDYVPGSAFIALSSEAYILPYTTADPTEFILSTTTPIAIYPPTITSHTFDVKLKHLCDHVLSTGTYKLENCPRCLGNGYYYDIKFDPDGLIKNVKGREKLSQELEKITLTMIGENTFHNLYGTILKKFYTGDVIGNVQQNQLKKSIINAVLRLKLLQQQSIAQGAGFDASELINKIDRIDIFEIYNNSTAIGFRVYINTSDNDQTTIEGTIIF